MKSMQMPNIVNINCWDNNRSFQRRREKSRVRSCQENNALRDEQIRVRSTTFPRIWIE